LKLPDVVTTGKALNTLVVAVVDGNRIGLLAKPTVTAFSLATNQNDASVRNRGSRTRRPRGPLVGSNLDNFVLDTGSAMFKLTTRRSL
jgi:hypothetical protein